MPGEKIGTQVFRDDESPSGESKKPNHVRRLNFGQAILTSERVKRRQEQENRVLWFNSNIENVACSTKDEFVRKWIETYDNSVFDKNEKASSSPILGLSATRQVRTSPVFGNRCRSGKRNDLLTLATRDARTSKRTYASERMVLEEIPSFPMDNDKGPDRRKGNVKRNLFDSPSVDLPPMQTPASVSPLLIRNSPRSCARREGVSSSLYSHRQSSASFETESTEMHTKSLTICTKAPAMLRSPILGMQRHLPKGKRRKLEAKENLRILDETRNNSYIDSNLNSAIVSCPTHVRGSNVTSEKANTLSEEIQANLKYCKLNSVPLQGSDNSKESTRSRSPDTNVQSKIENSPQCCAKSPARSEIRFSSEDDEPDFTDRIEDSDTQDLVVLPTFDNHILAHRLTGIPSKLVIFQSQRNDLDSDRTFFSEAEQTRYTPDSVQSSPKISHISSQVTDTRSNGSSSQTGMIVSTETSPRRAITHFTAQLTVVDSGKKRRKPKRGSLMEKLQLAINRRISFVRAWKHQLKQTLKQNTIVPCVTIFIQRRTARFGREFLEGTVLEDRFNLLPREEANLSTRYLTIITIPDVTGKTEMKSEGLIQIFPPWEVVDAEKLMLNVTYIRPIPNCGEIASQQIKSKMARLKRPTSKEYVCSCISANNMLPCCNNGANKPNVMAKLMC